MEQWVRRLHVPFCDVIGDRMKAETEVKRKGVVTPDSIPVVTEGLLCDLLVICMVMHVTGWLMTGRKQTARQPVRQYLGATYVRVNVAASYLVDASFIRRCGNHTQTCKLRV